KTLIEGFLRVFIDGQPVEGAESVVLDAPVQAALATLDRAFDYGLYGLQAHAVVFSLWLAMSRTYERLWAIVEAWVGEMSATCMAFRERLQRNAKFMQEPLLGTEERRVSRERVHADMYAQCAHGLGTLSSGATLAEHIAPIEAAHHGSAAEQL